MAVKHVALLRGINVGKAKRVAMADLRALVEGLGYTDVRTLLNSGNVVFTAPGADAKAAARIEAALVKETGVSARVLVLTGGELSAIVDQNLLGEATAEPSRLLVTVLADGADRKKLAAVEKEEWAPEKVAVGTRAVYSWHPAGLSGGTLADALAKALGDAATGRNWSTIMKLHALAGGTA
jgi:uncharacterized protein (DUF1697 family)